jgi:glycosyltransferase involved in cell wall biosynthesis
MQDQVGAANETDQSLSLLIPCFNESATIEAILRSACIEFPNAQMIVVDDASTDGSRAILQELADPLRLITISHPFNCGKGEAVRMHYS